MSSLRAEPAVASPFVSAPPVVELVNAFDDPYNNAVATARTCYASRVIRPADVDRDEAARAQRDAIAQSTYAAGHHTTLQHATFQFVLENVSRQLIWSLLHAHPFYNSEQVSQRYVAVEPEKLVLPRLPEPAARRYRQTADAQMACYRGLVELLEQPVADAFFDVFPARRKSAEKHKRAIKKKSQEMARYVLPIATFAHLYHTISGLTLHRYHRLCEMLDVPAEARLVVEAMVEEVRRVDPLFLERVEDPVPLDQTHERLALEATRGIEVSESARGFCGAFDAELGGMTSRLLDYKVNGEELLARSVRSVLGVVKEKLSDAAAVSLVLSPARNPYLAGALNLTSLGKLTRAMAHPHYTFQKKLSHTADSQDQRHRMVPGSRPILHAHYAGGEPDVILPRMIRALPAAHDLYMETMRTTWRAIDDLLADGVSEQMALYLLPNAFPIRFEESGDLAALHHKWTTRLCYNAQDEIWRASVEEVRQVREVHPHIGRFLEPPCGLRREASLRPICPEGPRFCGVPVWRLGLEDYQRVI
jgi:thymidylate synthase ThyX